MTENGGKSSPAVEFQTTFLAVTRQYLWVSLRTFPKEFVFKIEICASLPVLGILSYNVLSLVTKLPEARATPLCYSLL